MTKLRVLGPRGRGEKEESALQTGSSKQKRIALLLAAVCKDTTGSFFTEEMETREEYKKKTSRELVDELTSNASAAGMDTQKRHDGEYALTVGGIAVLLGSAGLAASMTLNAPIMVASAGAVILGGYGFIKGVMERAKAVASFNDTLEASEPAAYEMLTRKKIDTTNFDVQLAHDGEVPAIKVRAWKGTDYIRDTLAEFIVRSDGETKELA